MTLKSNLLDINDYDHADNDWDKIVDSMKENTRL